MFLEQGIKPENKFWKYLLGSVFIIAASFVGQIPLTVAVFYKTAVEKKAFPTTDQGVMKMFESNTTLFLIMISFRLKKVGEKMRGVIIGLLDAYLAKYS